MYFSFDNRGMNTASKSLIQVVDSVYSAKTKLFELSSGLRLGDCKFDFINSKLE